MKPWPGRNVTPQWSEGELELFPPRTLSGCSGIADSPFLIPRRQHFLAHLLPWTVLGVRLFVKLEALSFSFRSLTLLEHNHECNHVSQNTKSMLQLSTSEGVLW